MFPINPLKNNFPIISVLIIVSCLLSTIPQFFIPLTYSLITGQFPSLKAIYLITLPAFTHSPDFLLVHLIGNLVVIAFFGVMTEIIIGSNKFALVSLSTFSVTTFINYLHSFGIGYTHGASGIAFGYITVFIFVVIVQRKRSELNIFKNPIVIIGIILSLFFIAGIPILEVVVFKLRFFQNFGQIIHLISYCTVIPFIYFWRSEITENSFLLLANKSIKHSYNSKTWAKYILLFILSVNTFATVVVIDKTISLDGDAKIKYQLSPVVEANITDINQEIIIHFDEEMLINSEELFKKSINYEEEDILNFRTEWIDNQNMKIIFPRKFYSNESINLGYKIKKEIFGGIYLYEFINIKY